MEIYQVLHIPTGNYISSQNRNGQSVLFADEQSARKMIYSVVMHTSYIGGAPLTDFSVGNLDTNQDFCIEEFDCITTTPTSFGYPKPRILSLS